MQTSFCENGHEVWWGWLESERVPFVRMTYGYELIAEEDGVALPLRRCFRRHAEVCDSTRFTPPRTNHVSLRTPIVINQGQ